MVGRAEHKQAIRLEELKAELRKGSGVKNVLDYLCTEDGVQGAVALLEVKLRDVARSVCFKKMDSLHIFFASRMPLSEKSEPYNVQPWLRNWARNAPFPHPRSRSLLPCGKSLRRAWTTGRR